MHFNYMGSVFINTHLTIQKLYALSLCVLSRNILTLNYRITWHVRNKHAYSLGRGPEGLAAVPGVDLQCGLQELSTLLLGLGQLLHAQEVSGSPHLQHGDHGRVGVQSESHL